MRIANLPPERAHRFERALISIEGLSVGDGFGERFFAAEAASWIERRQLPRAPWRTTDDTEMALGILEVLVQCGSVDRDLLARVFGERYRRDPGRGYGNTAHRILQAIADGTHWRSASLAAFGGTGSMGNGGAMRAAPLGAWFADDWTELVTQARASAEVTHGHPEGQAGAIAVAAAAAWAWRHRDDAARRPHELLAVAAEHTPPGETRVGLVRALELPEHATIREAAAVLGNGSGVIAQDTVPFALWSAARNLGDFEAAMWNTVVAGGDVDTTCAIVGGIVAITAEVPPHWREAREPLHT